MRRMSIVVLWILLLLGFACFGSENKADRYHEGVINLKGQEKMVIANVVFHQAGSIWLHDSASLVIRNATLIFSKFDKFAWGPGLWGARQCISAHDESSIVMENVEILIASGEGNANIRVDAAGDSHVTLQNVRMPNGYAYGLGTGTLDVSNSLLRGLNVFRSSTVSIASSHLLNGLLLVVGGSTSGVLSALHPGYINEWSSSTDADLLNEPFSLKLTKTTVDYGWWVRVVDLAQLTIRNSQIVQIGLQLNESVGTISGLRTGLYESWSLAKQSLQADINLSLENVEVGGWSVFLRNPSRDITLINCEVGGVSIDGGSSKITFQDSWIGGFQISDFYGTLKLVNSSVKVGLQLNHSWLTLEGTFKFSEGSVVLWDQSTIVRTFQVRVLTSTGTPLPGVRIKAVGPYSSTFSTVTNESGEANLWVTFAGGGEGNTVSITASDGILISKPALVDTLSSDLVVIVLGKD